MTVQQAIMQYNLQGNQPKIEKPKKPEDGQFEKDLLEAIAKTV